MKVIDLINRIANGEEVPKKFMVDGDTLYIGEDKFIEYANGERIEWLIYPSWLNEEVEIIEEDKKMPEKLNVELNSGDENKVNYYRATNLECDLAFKINSIIDYLKSKGE